MGFNSAFKGLILPKEIIPLRSENRMKHKKTCQQNVEYLNVTACGTFSYQ